MAGQATMETLKGVKNCIDKIEFNKQMAGRRFSSGNETNLHLKKVDHPQMTAADKAKKY